MSVWGKVQAFPTATHCLLHRNASVFLQIPPPSIIRRDPEVPRFVAHQTSGFSCCLLLLWNPSAELPDLRIGTILIRHLLARSLSVNLPVDRLTGTSLQPWGLSGLSSEPSC